MPPVPVDLKSVLLTALFNPVLVAVAFWMGRCADEGQKVVLAAFVGAAAGSVVIYAADRLGVAAVSGVTRAAAGVFTAQFLIGLVWAAIGYQFARRTP
jgi:hypothetical protein